MLFRSLASGAVADEFLADQLMVPLALAGSGIFTLDKLSQHALTNATIIERFVPVTFAFARGDTYTTCTVTPACPA